MTRLPRGLVIVERHGFGSAISSLVRLSDAPLLVSSPTPASGPVLAVTDLGDRECAGLNAGRWLACMYGAELARFHCYMGKLELAELDRAPRHRQPGCSAVARPPPLTDSGLVRLLMHGPPAQQILEVAGLYDARAICLGRNRSTCSTLFNRVADEVVRRAACSVLVAR
jgi:nucleotide-binding universal stress UspA family protein